MKVWKLVYSSLDMGNYGHIKLKHVEHIQNVSKVKTSLCMHKCTNAQM